MNVELRRIVLVIFKKCILLLFIIVCYVPVWAQSDLAADIHKKFAAYQQQAVQEKVYAHTGKSFYVAGEIMWFKLYTVNATSHTLSELSKVAYVEVINAEHKPVLQAKIDLEEGMGNGSFLLPASINSGSYFFRVYTSWMKNNGPDQFFQKSITIVNTLKQPDWQQLTQPETYDVQFFPEGGNLVYGLQSKVGFKAVDQYGKGVACNGVLVRDNKDTVTRFQTIKFGMGHFIFTPAAGSRYKAVLQFESGLVQTKNLPDIYAQGYVLALTEPDSAHLNIAIQATGVRDAPVYLFVHAGQAAHEVLKKDLISGRAEFILDKKILPPGMAHLTLFDAAGQPLCERLYFERPVQELQINIKADGAQYKTRTKVSLNVATQVTGEQPAVSNLSVSVFLTDALQGITPENIQTWLWLTSELKGAIESPDYYLKNTDTDVNAALENLLLTQGWRRFRWEEIRQAIKPTFRFLPEFEGHVVIGKIVQRATGAAVPKAVAYLSVPGERFLFARAVSDSSGVIRFVLNKNYTGEQVIVQAEDSTQNVVVENPFSEQYTTTPVPRFRLSEEESGVLLAHSIATQAQYAFFKEAQQRFFIAGRMDTTSFFGVPDKRYFLDDYTRFATMEEVLREYVADVRLRKGADGFQYQVRNIPYQTFFEKKPLVLLDGVPVTDLNRLMAFDPLKIKKIDVVARKYFLNDLVAEGIVNLTTYNQDLAGFELPAHASVLDYNGMQLKRDFYAPVYELKEQVDSRLPDFRNLLTWLPDVKITGSGTTPISFYTSDLPGTYAVVVEGLDAAGNAGTSVMTFTVQK